MKLRFLAGVAAGYVLGTRAGRERYDQIRQSVNDLTESDLFTQVRTEVSKLTGGTSTSADSGVVSPPVIVGPGPEGATGSPNADVALPDLESSNAASITGETSAVADADATARRLDPPTGG